MVFIEIIILGGIFAFLWTRPIVRSWRANLRPGDLNLCVALAAMVAGGHFLAADARLFPLIQWRMYTTVYQPEKIEWAELVIEWSDNSTQVINPAHEFPTLARNHSERLTQYVLAIRDGKYKPRHETIYRKLLTSFAGKLNCKSNKREVIGISAVVQSVLPRDPSSINRQIIDHYLCSTNAEGDLMLSRKAFTEPNPNSIPIPKPKSGPQLKTLDHGDNSHD